jgi:hypothetical protein
MIIKRSVREFSTLGLEAPMKLSSLSTSWQGRSLEDVYKKRRGL